MAECCDEHRYTSVYTEGPNRLLIWLISLFDQNFGCLYAFLDGEDRGFR